LCRTIAICNCDVHPIALMPTPTPPVPVLVSQKDLPRALAVLVLGYAAVSWLVLRMDDYFAADEQDETMSFPSVHS
jgi:hypothetical protein